MVQRRSRHQAAPASPATAAVLLSGWGAPPLGGAEQHGFAGGFLELFEGNNKGIARLWRQHERYLRHEAARFGIEPESETDDGRIVFFGELAAELDRTQENDD